MIRNFVLETATQPRANTQVVLGGPTQGRQSWANAFPSGGSVFYFMDDGSAAEWGIGTLTLGTPNILARDTVIGNTQSPQGNTNRVDFGGATNVYNEIPGERMMYVDSTLIARLPAGAILDPMLGGTPVGASMDYWGAAAPSGWLWCNHQAVSRVQYARLYAALGGPNSPYGQGDGSTTFNVPDNRGLVTAGKDDMGGTASQNRLLQVMASTTLGALGGHQLLHYHGHPMYIQDPGHAHGVYDPQHWHHYVDPGHAHMVYPHTGFPPGQGFQFGYNIGAPTAEGYATDTRATGITITTPVRYDNGADGTGIAIYGNGTGIWGDAQLARGSGGSWVAEVGGGNQQNVQPTAICNRIIFAGA